MRAGIFIYQLFYKKHLKYNEIKRLKYFYFEIFFCNSVTSLTTIMPSLFKSAIFEPLSSNEPFSLKINTLMQKKPCLLILQGFWIKIKQTEIDLKK